MSAPPPLVVACRNAVASHQHFNVNNKNGCPIPEGEPLPDDACTVDVQTANVICTVWDGLRKQSNRDRFQSLIEKHGVASFGAKCWEVINRAGRTA